MSDKEEPRLEGVQFAPIEGRRSSQAAGKAIFADAVRAVAPEVARKIETSKKWRKDYIDPVAEIVSAGAGSAKDALRIAADGLDAVQRNMTFVTEDAETPLKEAFASDLDDSFETFVVQGTGSPKSEFQLPHRGEVLRGDRLLRQLDEWAERGVMEASCRSALQLVVDNPEWLDLSDRSFALLGAASEMGPLEPLASWGANLIAVDLPRPQLWEQIIATAKKGSGRLHLPVSRPAGNEQEAIAAAGADLMIQAPAMLGWLERFDQPFTIGNYVYADGANFVRLASAVDTMVATILEKRRDLSIAYLATPTDVFAVPEDVVLAVRSKTVPTVSRAAVNTLSGSRLFAPKYRNLVPGENGRRWGISDSLVSIQGPNYALSKSLQRWRAVLAREEGTLTSANVAPSARTKSVIKNRVLAAVYRGAPAFGVEIFEPETSRVLTAALLVHDIRNPNAVADPRTPLDHPYDLFTNGALHGGIWRMSHEARSVLPLGLVIGSIKRR